MSQGPNSELLALFRSEVETHTAVLKEGLEAGQVSGHDVEVLISAVHAIWGGARIVEFETAEKIACAMKKYLSAIQKSQVFPQPLQIDTLLQGVDLLRQIAEVGEKELLTLYQAEIERSVAAMSELLTLESADKIEVSKTDSQFQNSTPEMTVTESQVTNANETVVMTSSPLLELFQTEVETHVTLLNEGLLALENNPGAKDQLESLMRSAHSIKGGARVVGLEMAVQLAHSMEDCFVAAQKGKLSLIPEHIDVLLQGVDMLVHLSEIAISEAALNELKPQVEQLSSSISLIAKDHSKTSDRSSPPLPITKITEKQSIPKTTSEPKPTLTEAKLISKTKTKEPPPPVKVATNKDRMIRVTAAKIERLMGLAGEVVVSASWLPPFSQSLLELKKEHAELSRQLEKLAEMLGPDGSKERLLKLANRSREKLKDCGLSLADRLNQLDVFTSTVATHSDRLYHEVISVRMRPFADGAQGFPRMVRDLAKELGKKIQFEIIGKSTEVDQDIQEKLDAPLNHLLRNAIDHGIESPNERLAVGKPEIGTLRLEVGHRLGMLIISVIDDGRGIDLDKLRQKILHRGLTSADIVDKLTETELMDFLFLPGFSTADSVTEISGRGVGLDVVHSMIHEVGGVVRAISTPGQGLSVHLELPLTLSVLRTFLVEIAGESYAFPLARIDRCLILPKTDIDTVEDREYFRFGDNNIALVDIHDVLEMEPPTYQPKELAIVVVSDRLNSYGLVVDRFLGECDLVVRPLDSRLGKVPDISAVAVMLDGSPVLIFDVEDLVRSIDNLLSGKRLRKINELADEIHINKAKRILVVDDSITVREMERKLLENKGYKVEIAVDGMAGWNAVRTTPFDLVVSDIDMPRMNGIQLITHLKQHEELKSLPVIIVSYKDNQEHRLQGLQAGADYYLTKSSFEDDSFINAVVDLIGEA